MHWISKGRTITYAIDADADVRAEEVRFERFGETAFMLCIDGQREPVAFALNGRHNISNALAAAAVGHSFGMTSAEIAGALASVAPPPQRGEVLHFAAGFTIINDSYNSNPDALMSMVDTLVEGSSAAKRRIVVAGEMLELGYDAAKIHADTGARIAQSPVDILIGVRGLAKNMVSAAKAAGSEKALFAENSDEAGDLLSEIIRKGDVVLVKGSRGVATEKVIEKVIERFAVDGSQKG
jgi:UDP-N-acetylmuramoyl-tripeptide--D-alanyl-D-alanine ligase